MADFLLMLNHVVFFIILFGVLVFVHEFGHFILAKAFDVKVEKFSIGFGNKMIGKKWGETEYCISWFPLGGFVKLLGQEPEEEIPAGEEARTYLAKPPWQKLLIIVAGPVFNLIFPIFLFAALFMNGIPTITSKIGRVQYASPAYQAGLQDGDRVLAVNGQELWKWREMERHLRANPGREIELSVKRDKEKFVLKVTPQAKPGLNEFGEKAMIGMLGISPVSFRAAIGVADPDSPAYAAGFRTGEILLELNGNKLLSYAYLARRLERAKPQDMLRLKIELPVEDLAEKRQIKEVTLPVTDLFTQGKIDLEAYGLLPSELFIKNVAADSVAKGAGIKPGDLLYELDGKRIVSWEQFKELIEQAAGKTNRLVVMRAGQPVKLELKAVSEEIADELTGRKESHWRIGIESWAVLGQADEKKERILNPLKALWMGGKRTGKNVGMFMVGLYKLFRGRVSAEAVGGPIMIAKLAGASYQQGGWLGFFRILILLSITLGVINLLPIPILDGGHIIFSLIEWIRGKPLSVKAMEISNHIGLLIIIAIMGLAFYNDLNRFL